MLLSETASFVPARGIGVSQYVSSPMSSYAPSGDSFADLPPIFSARVFGL